MSSEDASVTQATPVDTMQGQPWFRAGYICFAVAFILSLATGGAVPAGRRRSRAARQKVCRPVARPPGTGKDPCPG